MTLLPSDLFTRKTTPRLDLMAQFYEKMTDHPKMELIELIEGLLILRGSENYHICLVFPFVDRIAQAYDCISHLALHVVRVSSDDRTFAPAYQAEREFSIVAPFVIPSTVAFVKEDDHPVIVNIKGKIVLDNVPSLMWKSLLPS